MIIKKDVLTQKEIFYTDGSKLFIYIGHIYAVE